MPGYLMALDRPDDDFEAGEARLEQHLRGSGRDGAAVGSEPPETRTREEYYEALRAADGSSGENSPGGDSSGDGSSGDGSAGERAPGDRSPEDPSPDDGSSAGERSSGDGPVADSRTDKSGWDAIDTASRPPLDAIHVSPDRTTHILDGDSNGGGHRRGVGTPEKTEFPASWDDKKIMSNVLDVARRPDAPPFSSTGTTVGFAPGLHRARDSVEVSVIVLRGGEVWTAWPEEGSPGVVRNPKKGNHDGNGDN